MSQTPVKPPKPPSSSSALPDLLSLLTQKPQADTTPPWDEWERIEDPRILGKTPFKVTNRFVGYCNKDQAEFVARRNEF
jgi:hypothetical protein